MTSPIDDLDARLIALMADEPRIGLMEASRRLNVARGPLESVPEVLEAHATSGPRDLLCRVAAHDTEQLQEIINRLLSTSAVRRSTSYIVLSTQIAHRTGPLVQAAAQQ